MGCQKKFERLEACVGAQLPHLLPYNTAYYYVYYLSLNYQQLLLSFMTNDGPFKTAFLCVTSFNGNILSFTIMLGMGTSLLNWKPRELDAKLGEVENFQSTVFGMEPNG